MSEYRLKYLKYKSKYLNYKLQKGGNCQYEPDKSKVINIDRETVNNTDYRRVIHTTDHSQLVLMCLKPGTEIGMELHEEVDQFIRVEKGNAKFSKNGIRVDYTNTNSNNNEDHTIIYDDSMNLTGKVINSEQGDLPQDHVLLVPRNTWHNVWNPKDATDDVHIYTVYSFGMKNSPHRKDMEVQVVKEDEPKEIH